MVGVVLTSVFAMITPMPSAQWVFYYFEGLFLIKILMSSLSKWRGSVPEPFQGVYPNIKKQFEESSPVFASFKADK